MFLYVLFREREIHDERYLKRLQHGINLMGMLKLKIPPGHSCLGLYRLYQRKSSCSVVIVIRHGDVLEGHSARRGFRAGSFLGWNKMFNTLSSLGSQELNTNNFKL